MSFNKELKNVRRGRINEYADKFKSSEFKASDRSLDHNPLWSIKANCAFPSATQNEIRGKDADNLMSNGIELVCEGSNMSTDDEGVQKFLSSSILYSPGKASNAGGVAVSGLEIAQNSFRFGWS